MKKLFSFLILSLFIGQVQAAANYLQAPAPHQHSALTPVTISVTSTSALAVAANLARTGLVCVNVGQANISLGFGGTAVNNYGVTLLPGVAFSMDDYLFTTALMNAVSPTTSTLSCQEYQ
jgi:hypothetical protein